MASISGIATFINFLDVNGLTEKFYDNFTGMRASPLVDFFDSTDDGALISGAFAWGDTAEGGIFWHKHDISWHAMEKQTLPGELFIHGWKAWAMVSRELFYEYAGRESRISFFFNGYEGEYHLIRNFEKDMWLETRDDWNSVVFKALHIKKSDLQAVFPKSAEKYGHSFTDSSCCPEMISKESIYELVDILFKKCENTNYDVTGYPSTERMDKKSREVQKELTPLSDLIGVGGSVNAPIKGISQDTADALYKDYNSIVGKFTKAWEGIWPEIKKKPNTPHTPKRHNIKHIIL